jgi:hypothetical protein
MIVGEQIVVAPFRVAHIAVLFDCIHRSTPWGGLPNGHRHIRACGHHCLSCWRLRDEARETSIGESLISCSRRDPTRLVTLVVTRRRTFQIGDRPKPGRSFWLEKNASNYSPVVDD